MGRKRGMERERTKRRREKRADAESRSRFRPRWWQVVAVGAALALAAAAWFGSGSRTPVDGIKVLGQHPHDPEAYCQGLSFHDGALYESTGRAGHSTLRRVVLETGEVAESRSLPEEIFGEGITIFGDRIYQLTWKAGVAYVWDLASLEKQRELTYEGEGWGLTHDGRHLIMSDGTTVLQYRDPESFEVVRRLEVTGGGRAGANVQLNELEYIDGEIFANVYQRDRIVRISPKTGEILRWMDLGPLRRRVKSLGSPEVLNGIAWDAEGKRLFVTGKNWPRLYEIEIVPES